MKKIISIFIYIYIFLGFTVCDLKYSFLLKFALSVLSYYMATGFKPQGKVLATCWRFYHKFLSEITHSFVKGLLHKDQSNWNKCAASSAHLVIFWPSSFLDKDWNHRLEEDMVRDGSQHSIFSVPVFFFHMIHEYIPFFSNAALWVSVICDADLT